MKKLFAILTALSVCASAVLSGCSAETRIDSAALAQTVTVRRLSNRRVYTFYLLDGDGQRSVEISADSFSSAVVLAENRYIPSVSLAKLELVLFESEDETFINDIEYMAADYEISPLTLTAFASGGAMDVFEEEKSALDRTKRCIELLKINENDISANILSVFNNSAALRDNDNAVVSMAYISAEKELKAERTEFSREKSALSQKNKK